MAGEFTSFKRDLVDLYVNTAGRAYGASAPVTVSPVAATFTQGTDQAGVVCE